MTFGIALGSNLGDRLHNLRKAMQAISAMPFKTRVLAIAPVYESIPVDCPPGSQNFFNTVVEIAADAEPMALLLELRSIEMRLGRPDTHEHHAPRVIDLDVLYADDVVTSHPELILPHPRLHERRFVLQPLADIRPLLMLPGQTRSVAALLASLDSPEPLLRLVATEWPGPE